MLVDELLTGYYAKGLIEQIDTIKMVCESLISIPEDAIILQGSHKQNHVITAAGK